MEQTLDAKVRDLLRSSTLEIRALRQRLHDIEVKQNEPIAVVGMACRFPGGANDLNAYWELLAQGRHGIVPTPPERWDSEALYDPNPDAPGKMYARHIGAIDGVDQFDAELFGISPREADYMDPQQRLLLEVVWHALEDARQPFDRLRGSATGVFVGEGTFDYYQLQQDSLETHSATGVALSVLAGRVAYTFGLQGPALCVDTACSSSLVAVHLACQSLRMGECEMAIVGGVNLILAPGSTMCMSKLRALSPEGLCKAFDASADGYVRGEGCGVVILKRLRDAERTGDRVLALIRGSAVNHDGRSNGLTAPSGPSQQAVIRRALEAAGVAPHEVEYVETHGTGTKLGDPIELHALDRVLRVGRAADEALRVGSVKTNVGHLEAAAGMASLIKTVLMLQHGQLVPHLHFKNPSPDIDWANLSVEVSTKLVDWPRRRSRRVAGVSGFAFSGTNAHLILEEAAPLQPCEPEAPGRGQHLLKLSAHSADALRELALRHLSGVLPAEHELQSYVTSAAMDRGDHQHRLAVVVRDPADVRTELESYLAGRPSAAQRFGIASTEEPRVAFLFTGQGSQYLGMSRGLYQSEPAFRESLERCSELLVPLLGRSLLDLIYAPDGDLEASRALDNTGFAQPALFCLGYSLHHLLVSWGIRPDVVLGHSVGEVIAACVAGVFDLEQGLAFTVERGRAMQALPPGGAMFSFEASEGELKARLAGCADLSIAAVNAPTQTVVSGPRRSLEALAMSMRGQGRRVRELNTSHAFHSALIEPALPAIGRAAELAAPGSCMLPLISNLSGQAAGEELRLPDYWCRQAREPVRFAQSLRTLEGMGVRTLVELGPQPTLLGLARQQLERTDVRCIPTLRKDADDARQLLLAFGELYVAGAQVDWSALMSPRSRRTFPLPKYPLQRRRYWVSSAPRRAVSSKLHGRSEPHPLSGPHFVAELECATQPYLADHCVHGEVVVPGAWHFAATLSAARELYGTRPLVIRDAEFLVPRVLHDDVTPMHLLFSADHAQGEDERAREVTVFSPGRDGSWEKHASMWIQVVESEAPSPVDLKVLRERCENPVENPYGRIREAGLSLGATFRWIAEIDSGDREAFARLERPDELYVSAEDLHPALIDACFQSTVGVLGEEIDAGVAFLPSAVDRLERFPGTGEPAWCHVKLGNFSAGASPVADVQLFDGQGRTIMRCSRLVLRRATREQLLAMGRGLAPATYETQWRPASLPYQRKFPAGDLTLVIDDGSELGDRLSARLDALGSRCVRLQTCDEPRLRKLAEMEAGEVARVINLLPLSTSPDKSDHLWETQQRLVCGSTLAILRAIDRQVLPGSARVFVVTRGAVSVTERDRVDCALATLSGLNRVFASEQPERPCLLVDLDPTPHALEADQVCAAMHADVEEVELAFRAGEAYVSRVARCRQAVGAKELGFAGTQLITGGLGALGLELAAWLADRGAREIVLIGRKPPSAVAQSRIEDLRKRGVQSVVRQADVSDASAMQALFAELASTLPPVTGVFHLAGVLRDRAVLEQTWEDFVAVLTPKLQGALNLHRLTEPLPIRHFVLFSSAAALFGSRGQAAYAAANAFLDALARARRNQGKPGLSIDWGPFHGAGMASDVTGWEQRGVTPLDPARAFTVLGSLMASDAVHAGVIDIDGARASGLFAHGRVPRHMQEVVRAKTEVVNERGELKRKVLALDAEDRLEHLQQEVAAHTLRVLRRDPSSYISWNEPLGNMGMDSLMAVELRDQLSRVCDVKLSANMAFDFPNVRRIAEYLLERMGGAAARRPKLVQPGASELEALDDDVMLQALESTLQAIEGGK